jgi:hypothetical protein
VSTRDIRIGGLLRCCVQTIVNYDGPEVPGETEIPCAYHNEDRPTARLTPDGVWIWAGPVQSER